MHYRKSHSLALGMLLAAGLPSALLANNVNGRWSAQFGWPIIPIHATLLPDGQVFAFGTTGNGDQGAMFEYSIWNFWAGWGAHNKLPNQYGTDIFCSATGLLPNGDVLVAGGDTRNPINNGIADSFVLQWGPKTLQRTGYMANARWYPTLMTLPNGETLVHGGVDQGHNPVGVPEIYNNGGWRSLWGANNGDIINNDEGKWFYPRDWVAPNGRVFGITGNTMYFLDWGGNGGTQIAGYLPNKSRSHTSAAVMYQPGKILQVGGSTNGDTQAEGSRQAITVDVTGGWPQVQDVQDMGWRRVWPSATVLPNGEVLVTGGSAFENKNIDAATTAEIWNPNTRQFRRVAAAQTPRMYHSVALLLPDASVMIGGGGAPGPLTNLNSEIYYPPYLFNGGEFANRPTIGDFNVQQGYNNVQNIPFGGDVARVTLVRNGAVTHSWDAGQRFNELGFQVQGNGTVNVSFPNNPNIAPPGYYMLFFMNGAGVPSYAKIVHLDGGNGSNNGAGAAPAPNPGPVAPAPGGGGGGDVHSLIARHSGKCIDVEAASMDNGARIQQYECNGSDAQKFRIQDAGNGNVRLQNVKSGKCLDVDASSQANGGRLIQWDCSNGPNQSAKMENGTENSKRFRFNHSNKCMDVAGPDANNGTAIHQWDCFDGVANQEFWLD
jgi:hypothetical protein